MRRHGVVGVEVCDDLESDHYGVEIEHLPVEPSPFCLVLGLFLLGFVQDPPLGKLMWNVEGPRYQLTDQWILVAAIRWSYRSIRPRWILNKTIGVSSLTFFIYKAFNTEPPIEANHTSGQAPNEDKCNDYGNPINTMRTVPVPFTQPVS